ncbi:glycosyltransferase [Niallia sp. Sow4_A1]|uniref:glycosyltransferase n=1 Tax=Niallia sp. Sow4_A1 TaxID=3438793 RepID=UPI003F9D7C2A
MNICIINESFSVGGVERVTTELANTLQNNGNKVSLIDFSGENAFYYKVNEEIGIPKIVKKRKLRIKVFEKILKYRYHLIKKTYNLNSILKEPTNDLVNYLRKSRPDILIMNQGRLTALIPAFKKEIPNLKIIAWQHNEFDIYMQEYYKAYKNDYISGVKQADVVICLSENDEKQFSNINKNSVCIYNPITIKNEENKLSNIESKYIIFVSRLLIRQKGLDHLIEIAKNIKNGWRILIAGDGPDKNKFKKMIKLNKLEDIVILKGNLNTRELSELYLSGSVFISTSRWEGFGLVITEAMTFGLPIISFNNSGPRDILKNGEYGILIEQNNIQEFIQELNMLLEDPEKRKAFQKKGLKRTQEFKEEVIFKKWNYKMQELI